MQKVGDCDFFGWADNEMSTYEKKNDGTSDSHKRENGG